MPTDPSKRRVAYMFKGAHTDEWSAWVLQKRMYTNADHRRLLLLVPRDIMVMDTLDKLLTRKTQVLKDIS